MKQSKTTLKELTAAYRAVLRHGILCNAIALGLVAMPAMAENNQAKIGETEYATLTEAMSSDAARGGEIVTLLQDVKDGSGLSVKSGADITVDLNGYTYTAYGPSVGSTGTETQVFQLLKDSNVTFKNGTLDVSVEKADNGVFKMLLQNYSNMTLDGVVVDGTNLVGAGTGMYVTSNNNGITNIKNSKIITKYGDFAFDLWYWVPSYTDGVYVNVENSEILGKVEIGAPSAAIPENILTHAVLTVKGNSTITGSVENNGGTINLMNINNNITGSVKNNGAFVVVDGESTVDGGITGNGSLTINEGATLNIGTASIEQGTITLNGDMFATLRDSDDAQITASEIAGGGKLNLTMSKAGKYHVFGGDKDFKKILSANAVYELSALDDGYIEAIVKSTEAIAGDTHIAHESAAAVSHIASAASVSESKQLQELSLKLQEKLANGDTASVEHATKAVHPETESVAQSVSSSVQNTVVNVASSRMALPTVGRSAGDVNLTSGGVWTQGLFNKSKQNDAFHGYTRGIAAGLDGTINKVWTIGAGYSFAHSDVTGSARDTEIDSNTLFLYGQYKPSEWYVNAIANYTWSDYSEKGSVIDGALVSADYDVQSFGGHIATGYNFDNGITPELGLRYMHVNADDYTNSYGIKTSMKDTDFLTGVVGAKYAFNIVAGKHTTFAPQLSANAKYDMLSDKSVATIAMPGVDAYTIDGNRLNRFGGEFGIGLGMMYDNLHMSINYDIDVRKDYTSQTGMLKFRYNF